MSTPLLDFYRGKKRDSEKRTLKEIWEWSDADLEYHHDFIQWMFPLVEPSMVNADAPLLTAEDQAAFRNKPELKAAMQKSLDVFLAFVGLIKTADGRVIRGENFIRRQSIWTHSNHNWLRITRVLKSLRLLGFEEEARAFWNCLEELHEKDGFVSENSFEYWKDAADGLEKLG
jgi:hypothetical protein